MSEITSDDYGFVERDDQEHWVVWLKTGKWADTYLCYDQVKLIAPEEGWESEEEATLSFRYGLIESTYDLQELSEDVDFNDYLGDILRHIIQDSFDTGKYRIGEDGKTD